LTNRAGPEKYRAPAGRPGALTMPRSIGANHDACRGGLLQGGAETERFATRPIRRHTAIIGFPVSTQSIELAIKSGWTSYALAASVAAIDARRSTGKDCQRRRRETSIVSCTAPRELGLAECDGCCLSYSQGGARSRQRLPSRQRWSRFFQFFASATRGSRGCPERYPTAALQLSNTGQASEPGGSLGPGSSCSVKASISGGTP
jgi:hypothetical protein